MTDIDSDRIAYLRSCVALGRTEPLAHFLASIASGMRHCHDCDSTVTTTIYSDGVLQLGVTHADNYPRRAA
jgi:hypothetical protein